MAEEHVRLAQAQIAQIGRLPNMNMWSPGSSSGRTGAGTLDKFSFPKDYYEIITLCAHYYRTDPLISNTLNKILDIGFKEYALDRRDCTDEEFDLYSSFNSSVLFQLKELGLEYMLSGLVVPEVTWVKKSGNEINPNLGNTMYEVPETLWNRDPQNLKLRGTPIPNRVLVTVEISDEDIAFIKNKGVFPDGFEDKETYAILVREYPEFVAAVNDDKQEFKIDSPHLIRRNPLKDSPYPTPYLLPILEPIAHKRNLRKMDYALAARVITAIMLIRVGNDEYPLVEGDDDIIANLKSQMLYRGNADNMERLFQLFANHTVQIDWIMPDVTALLDDAKYESVNTDILFGLGFPRIVLVGETAKTGTSQAEYALLSPAESIKSIRNELLSWPRELYKQMRDRNTLKNLPEPTFSEIRLYDLQKLLGVADILYERGVLSKTTFGRLGGFDFERTELPMRVREQELLKAAGIPELPEMPFTKQTSEDTPAGNSAT